MVRLLLMHLMIVYTYSIYTVLWVFACWHFLRSLWWLCIQTLVAIHRPGRGLLFQSQPILSEYDLSCWASSFQQIVLRASSRWLYMYFNEHPRQTSRLYGHKRGYTGNILYLSCFMNSSIGLARSVTIRHLLQKYGMVAIYSRRYTSYSSVKSNINISIAIWLISIHLVWVWVKLYVLSASEAIFRLRI